MLSFKQTFRLLDPYNYIGDLGFEVMDITAIQPHSLWPEPEEVDDEPLYEDERDPEEDIATGNRDVLNPPQARRQAAAIDKYFNVLLNPPIAPLSDKKAPLVVKLLNRCHQRFAWNRYALMWLYSILRRHIFSLRDLPTQLDHFAGYHCRPCGRRYLKRFDVTPLLNTTYISPVKLSPLERMKTAVQGIKRQTIKRDAMRLVRRKVKPHMTNRNIACASIVVRTLVYLFGLAVLRMLWRAITLLFLIGCIVCPLWYRYYQLFDYNLNSIDNLRAHRHH